MVYIKYIILFSIMKGSQNTITWVQTPFCHYMSSSWRHHLWGSLLVLFCDGITFCNTIWKRRSVDVWILSHFKKMFFKYTNVRSVKYVLVNYPRHCHPPQHLKLQPPELELQATQLALEIIKSSCRWWTFEY